MKRIVQLVIFVFVFVLFALSCRNSVGGTDDIIPLDFVKLELKGKSFSMGSTGSYANPGKKVHTVKFTRNIIVCDHEVTQSEYEKYCMHGNYTNGKGDNNPVYEVNWYDAIVYCNLRSMADGLTPCYKLGEETDPKNWTDIIKDNVDNPIKYAGPRSNNANWNTITCDWYANGYRLPTEAEWEYAARGGISDTNIDVWAGTTDGSKENLENYMVYKLNSGNITSEVKQKLPNGYGLYDMSGNVYEWCWDWFAPYGTEEQTDPVGPSVGTDGHRVVRGGSWNYDLRYCCVSFRLGAPTVNRGTVGFRVVRASF